MRILTDRLVLRDFETRDAENLARNINNLNITKWLLVVPYPYRMKDAEEFIGKQRRKIKKKPRADYTLAIERKEEKGIIGAVGLHDINKFQGTAKMGYWLGEDYWRNGYMSEAVSAVLKFAFRRLKLRRINVEAFGENKASNELIKKIGFVYEGMRRRNLRSKANKKIYDENIYGMLREEYLRLRK